MSYRIRWIIALVALLVITIPGSGWCDESNQAVKPEAAKPEAVKPVVQKKAPTQKEKTRA